MVSKDPKTVQDRLWSVSTLCVCTPLVSGPCQAPQPCIHRYSAPWAYVTVQSVADEMAF